MSQGEAQVLVEQVGKTQGGEDVFKQQRELRYQALKQKKNIEL